MLVLAAGAGSRFAAAGPSAVSTRSVRGARLPVKLLALLDGRPILEHVLERAAALGPATTIVVLGHGTGAEALEVAIGWRGERRLRNPRSELGLAGSLRIGLAGLADPEHATVQAALIMLGDQPRVSVEVMRRLLLEADVVPDRAFVAPSYAVGGGNNPLLVRREAWPLAASLEGDRGFGPLLAARPELVQLVAVPGDNPDVDTPADVAALGSG
ncbi:MAG: NTP transferase domain-containing protein [Chloroflexota bacterium]|nr:NTP transferase domain-containing protein [Chloroflexota bacterium]